MSAPYDANLDLIRSELLTGFIELALAEAALQTGLTERTSGPKKGQLRRLTTLERSELTAKCAEARTQVRQWAAVAQHRAAATAFQTAELLVNTAETATLKELHSGINALVATGALR
jgi:hypothetical protein